MNKVKKIFAIARRNAERTLRENTAGVETGEPDKRTHVQAGEL
jgi:hypothetical protein